ncbi:MAG: ATP-binding protein [Planctomycetaceae bacterium]
MTIAVDASKALNIDVADIVPWGLCTIDRDLCVTQWNRTLERWTEIPRGDAMAMMRGAAEAKGLILDSRIVGTFPERAETDPTRLRQILLNLLSNAIKFTKSGSVRVTAETNESQQLLIRVLDTGRGMSASQIARVFQPFEQADASMVREQGGTGLGLSISRELASMLGGTLTVESEPGRGSSFSLTIDPGNIDHDEMLHQSCRLVPAEDGNPTERDQPVAVNTPVASGCRVLLAEDTRCMQHLIVRLCEKAGATVVSVDDGQAAYETAIQAQVDAQPFDLILMDMQMPVCDGYSATRRLRNNGYEGPIVALTAHAQEGDREKCINAECDDYVTKPIDRGVLTSLLQRHTPVTTG